MRRIICAVFCAIACIAPVEAVEVETFDEQVDHIMSVADRCPHVEITKNVDPTTRQHVFTRWFFGKRDKRELFVTIYHALEGAVLVSHSRIDGPPHSCRVSSAGFAVGGKLIVGLDQLCGPKTPTRETTVFTRSVDGTTVGAHNEAYWIHVGEDILKRIRRMLDQC